MPSSDSSSSLEEKSEGDRLSSAEPRKHIHLHFLSTFLLCILYYTHDAVINASKLHD